MILPIFTDEEQRKRFFDNLEGQRKYDALNAIIDDCDHIVFFGGAGVSKESGLPDFRGSQGVYTIEDELLEQYSPEYILSEKCIREHPEVYYTFHRKKLFREFVEPNRTHYKLAEMEAAGKLDGIITQNTDGLHHRAGSKNVFSLHGGTRENYCMDCGKRFPRNYIARHPELIARCSECGGLVRPDVVLFGDPLPKDAWEGSKKLITEADCLIVGGSSLKVRPACSLLHRFRGKYFIIINIDETPFDDKADLIFHENIGDVFARICLKNASS